MGEFRLLPGPHSFTVQLNQRVCAVGLLSETGAKVIRFVEAENTVPSYFVINTPRSVFLDTYAISSSVHPKSSWLAGRGAT